MTTISYHGVVQLMPFQDATIKHDELHPGYISASLTQVMNNKPIIWDSQSGPLNMTVAKLFANPEWNTMSYTNTTIEVTGNQAEPVAATYYVTVELAGTTTNGYVVRYSTTNSIPYTPFSSMSPFTFGPTNVNNVPGTENLTLLTEARVSSRTVGLLYDYDTYNVDYNIRMDVYAIRNCVGAELQTPTCMAYCAENKAKCIQPYIEYCTPHVLAANPVCQSFITNYLSANGPVAQLDNTLQSYCQKNLGGKYDTIESLYDPSSKASDFDKLVCACHMQDNQYDSIKAQLTKDYPEIGAVYNVVSRCMVPQCVDSPYPALPMSQGGCKIPECLQISVFENNGSFTGNVDVSQTCTISGGGTDKTAIYIAAILAIVMLIALVVYLLL